MMRELGIIPVFPPREDVQVGDVYIAPVSPDEELRALKKKEFLPLGLWLATLDVTNDVSGFYSSRPSFPTTPTNTTDFMNHQTNNPFAGLPQAQDTNRNIFIGGDATRLRMVGFPSFMSATFNKGDLAAVVPVEAVNLAFGAGFTSARSVTVSVPVAESYGIPADKVWPKVMTADGKLMDFIPGVPQAQMHNLVNAKQVVQSGTNYYAPLRIITEVYYTRALDISVASQTTRGFGIAGRPLVTDAISTAASAASSVAGSSSNTTASATSSNAPVFVMPGVTNFNGNAVERAAEMNRSLEQAMAQTVPGGSLKFVAAGDRGVSMRRTYDRPIAIGYRALQVLVPLQGKEFNFGGAVGGFVPTSMTGSLLSPVSMTGVTNAPLLKTTTTNTPPLHPVQPDNSGTLQPGRPVTPNR